MKTKPASVALFVAGAMVCAVADLTAQTIRGVVLTKDDATPVGRGFVVLLDTTGREVARTLSDAEGRFSMRGPSAGVFRLRSERIGFRVFQSPLFTLHASQVLDYRLEVTPVPVRLSAIEVRGQTSCDGKFEIDAGAALVWEEARKALAAVSWEQSQAVLKGELRLSERELDARFLATKELSRHISGAFSTTFRSPPPKDLASKGYIRPMPEGDHQYYGPDATVLFSREFLEGHCFRLRRDRTAPGLLGIVFEPARRSDIADVSGVMWLDESSAELRRVDYAYTNVPGPITGDSVGGRVEFLRLPTGSWIVERWRIRMPIFDIVRRPTTAPISTDQPAFVGHKEDLGEIVRVFDITGAVIAGISEATVRGHVFDSIKGEVLPGASVVLIGTLYVMKADDGGHYHSGGLPDGDYEIGFTHPRYDEYGIIGRTAVHLRGATTSVVDLAVPPKSRLKRPKPQVR